MANWRDPDWRPCAACGGHGCYCPMLSHYYLGTGTLNPEHKECCRCGGTGEEPVKEA